jgi:hypothetical protein
MGSETRTVTRNRSGQRVFGCAHWAPACRRRGHRGVRPRAVAHFVARFASEPDIHAYRRRRCRRGGWSFDLVACQYVKQRHAISRKRSPALGLRAFESAAVIRQPIPLNRKSVRSAGLPLAHASECSHHNAIRKRDQPGAAAVHDSRVPCYSARQFDTTRMRHAQRRPSTQSGAFTSDDPQAPRAQT